MKVFILVEHQSFILKNKFKFKATYSPLTLFSWFLGHYLRHMEVPRLGVESELRLPA